MTRVAFYAPLKSPFHPAPSGDRAMARNLMTLLEYSGYTVDLASELRIFDKEGSEEKQATLFAEANTTAQRLIDTMPATDVWLTYHNYYKAPDLIGPVVSKARGIPYVQIESTRAKKRIGGAWNRFALASHAASDAADLIFYLTEQDRFALERDRPAHQTLVQLPPFLPRSDLPPTSAQSGPMLSVGMMRDGDKLLSYQLIAQTLACLTSDWSLNLVGDGAARAQVARLMAPFGDRVQFLGQLSRDALQLVYSESSLFFWPGVNEAFGMVYLEAQAAGLPVVAQNRPGVCDVLAPGTYPDVEDGPEGLARAIETALNDSKGWPGRSRAARTYIEQRHLMPAASQRFQTAFTSLLEVKP